MIIKNVMRRIGIVLVMMSVALIVMGAAPTINFNEPPTPINGNTTTVNYVNVSVTLNESGTALIKWDTDANVSMIGSGMNYYYNKTLPNGLHTYIVYANDTTPQNWSSEPRTVTINVPGSPPSITDYQPNISPVNTIFNNSQTFNVTIDQTANVSWKIGLIEVQNLSTTLGKSEYINNSAAIGSYSITATAYNENGSSSPQPWTWIVSPAATPGITGLTATRGATWINWTWTTIGGNYNHTTVLINTTPQSNTSNNYFNYSYFEPGTSNTIILHAVDTSGVINNTAVQDTRSTLNTPTGSNVVVNLTTGLRVIFSQVDAEGNTSFISYPTKLSGWPDHNNFVNVEGYYNISTDANTGGNNITVELKYSPTGINESQVRLWHLRGSTWEDITTSLYISDDKVLGNDTTLSPFVVGIPPKPKFLTKNPSTSFESIVKTPVEFNVTIDQTTNVTWSISPGSSYDVGQVLAGIKTNYTFNPSSSNNYTVTVTATNISSGTSDSTSWNWTVRPKTYSSGNRVWDGGKPAQYALKYTWDPLSFYAFFYDLDSGFGSESLEISLDSYSDRLIEKNDLKYTTTPYPVYFAQEKWGKYNVIGFMTEKYFAGYSSLTSPDITTDVVSPLSNKQLHKILIDDDKQQVIYAESTLTLQEGYVIKIRDVDASGRIVLLSLLKDGGEVDTQPVGSGGTYVYTKKVGVVTLPIIALRVETVFSGKESSAAFTKGIFQISESYTSASNNRYGVMEITRADAAGIDMYNSNSFTLSQGSIIDIMGDLKFIVADNSTLRFAPMVIKDGAYEVRGTIAQNNDTSFDWTPMNFEGFYYNINDDVGTETLSMTTRSGTSIPEGKLVYTTTPMAVSYNYENFGSFKVIGFMADKYFAGYIGGGSGCTNCITTTDKSTIAQKQLHKVLVDDDTQRVIYAGSTLTLNDGYVIKIKDVNIGAGTASVWLEILKDGTSVYEDIKEPGQIFSYAPSKVGVISDLPIISLRIYSIFRGKEATAAFIKGVFQISETYTSVSQGDRFGIMEVTEVSDTQIQMDNPSTVSLSAASTFDVMGNIKFKVADSSDVRFYPFIMANGTTISASQLSIDAPATPMARDTITITVTAGAGTIIDNAEVSFDGTVIGNTNSSGKLDYLLTKSGQHTITATKLGYDTATRTIQVSEYRDIALRFELPVIIDQGIPVTIKVISNGSAILGANITFDGKAIGLTSSDGTLQYTFDVSGTHNLGASKTGYISVVREISVRMPFIEFKALDLNITPAVIFTNQNYVVRANISNVGTKGGMLEVGLVVNDTVIDNKNVTLDPGATQEINFTQKMTLPPGNYTVEILDQKATIPVKEEPFNPFLVVGIITVIGAVSIFVLTSKEILSIEALKAKLNMGPATNKPVINTEAINKVINDIKSKSNNAINDIMSKFKKK